MHGRVKTRTTEEQKEIARREKCKKAKIYKETMEKIIQKRMTASCDKESLELTSSLLTNNPDIITLWNYRREIFLTLKNEYDVEEYQKLLEKDLGLTEQCLRVNPKSYGSWHHRVWILDNLPTPDWDKELKLCTKYLQLDERNFHCWDYRRTVTQRSQIPDESEYKYTLEKIETNFSNYSAWHLRSKLLPKIFPDLDKKFPISEDKHKEELELVENAAFTDPNDQSAWFYLRWLLDLTEAKVSLVFVEVKGDEIFLVTSRSVKLSDYSGVGIEISSGGGVLNGVWKSSCQPSCLWTFRPNSKINKTNPVHIALKENGVQYNSYTLEPNQKIQTQPNFYPVFSDNVKQTLNNQLSSCEQLLELEPDSKWTLLTSIFLMLYIDASKYENQILQRLDNLSEIDYLHKGYYSDLRSKILIQSAINTNTNKNTTFCLKNKQLTALYHSQYLSCHEEVDLSGNEFSSDSLINLYALVNCKILNLSKNKIKCINNFPTLKKLEILILDYNSIEDVNENWIDRFPNLKSLSLVNNSVSEKQIDNLCGRLSKVVV